MRGVGGGEHRGRDSQASSVLLGRLDVVKMFPSLVAAEVAMLVREKYMRAEDWRLMTMSLDGRGENLLPSCWS